jgi:hypothetical protein
MAITVPLNVFKSLGANLTTASTLLYVAPTEVTSIILMAQVSNTSNTVANVTCYYKANNQLAVELVKEYSIPPNDASTVLTGKLVLEQSQGFYAQAGDNNKLKIVMSVLETSNQ